MGAGGETKELCDAEEGNPHAGTAAHADTECIELRATTEYRSMHTRATTPAESVVAN